MESAPESDDKSTGIDKSEALFLCMTAAALEAGTFPSMIRLTELWNTTTGEAASTNAITKRLKGLKNKAQEILDANTNNITLDGSTLASPKKTPRKTAKKDTTKNAAEGVKTGRVAKAKGKATKSALLANSAGSGEEEVKSNEEDTSKEPAET